jgi:hypothetical protein
MGLVGRQFYSREAVIHRYSAALATVLYSFIVLPPGSVILGAVIFLYTGSIYGFNGIDLIKK